MRPKDHDFLVRESLWLSIEHGLGKFSKYRCPEYSRILILENVSGEAHSSMLLGFSEEKSARLRQAVDYIIVFESSNGRMAAGSVWKEKERFYATMPVPYDRRFNNEHGNWVPLVAAEYEKEQTNDLPRSKLRGI